MEQRHCLNIAGLYNGAERGILQAPRDDTMNPPADPTATKRRGLADPVGFAHTRQQIVAVSDRIEAQDGARLDATFTTKSVAPSDRWRVAIAPHDDYAYAGFMYPLDLDGMGVTAPATLRHWVGYAAVGYR